MDDGVEMYNIHVHVYMHWLQYICVSEDGENLIDDLNVIYRKKNMKRYTVPAHQPLQFELEYRMIDQV